MQPAFTYSPVGMEGTLQHIPEDGSNETLRTSTAVNVKEEEYNCGGDPACVTPISRL